jgi:Tfp pilus assembly protein PilF
LQRKWGGALALVYVASGRFEDGCQLIEKSFEVDPSDSRTLGHLAFIYGLMDNKTKAAEFLARYLEIRPEVKTADDYANIMPAFIKDKTRAGMLAAGMN